MGERSIAGELEYYRNEVADSLALAYSEQERFPIEILNEVRNAMLHLARTAHHGESSEDGIKNLRRAHRHLERVRLDCAKLVYILRAEKMELDFEAIADDGHVAKTLASAFAEIKSKRRRLVEQEAHGPAVSVVDGYHELILKAEKLHDRMATEYPILLEKEYRENARRKMDNQFKAGRRAGRRDTLVIGVVASLIATGIATLAGQLL